MLNLTASQNILQMVSFTVKINLDWSRISHMQIVFCNATKMNSEFGWIKFKIALNCDYFEIT